MRLQPNLWQGVPNSLKLAHIKFSLAQKYKNQADQAGSKKKRKNLYRKSRKYHRQGMEIVTSTNLPEVDNVT